MICSVVIAFCACFLLFALPNATAANSSVAPWLEKRSASKATKLEKLVERVITKHTPSNFEHEGWSIGHHHNSRWAIFAVGMWKNLRPREVKLFVETARNAGFRDDIVIAILPGTDQVTIDLLKELQVIVYAIDIECSQSVAAHFDICSMRQFGAKRVPVAMLRYYLYQWWAMKYSDSTKIMLSDFRDVFFQSHPFYHRYPEWRPHQLTVFQEHFPNKVISRCGHNRRWIRNCYGEEGLALIETNTVLCSGVTFGSRAGIIGYTNLMLRQLKPEIRYRNVKAVKGVYLADNVTDKCYFEGMDQGLHNWLVYSGLLDIYMDVKIYQQGEGPVNTLGGLMGKQAIVVRSLSDWGILKGEAPNQYIYNWNGEKSPVIHQADRFLGSDFKHGYRGHLAIMQGVKSP